MATAQESIKVMVSSLHKRYLKDLGFRKNANTWVRSGDWPQVVNVQLSKWNTSDEAEITLNLGISIVALRSLVEGLPIKGSLKEYDCDVRTRIGELHPDKMDGWWAVTAVTDGENLAAEIFSNLVTYGFPWFERLRDYKSVAEEFTNRNNFFMASASYLLNGNRALAEERLTEAHANSNTFALPRIERWARNQSIPLRG